MLIVQELITQDRNIDSADQFASALRHWHIDVRQLASQSLKGQLSRIDFDRISLTKLVVNCQIEIDAHKSSNNLWFMTLGANQEGPHFSQGTPVGPNCIFGCNPQQQINFVSAPQGTQLLILEMDQACLARQFADKNLPFSEGLLTNDMIVPEAAQMTLYTRYLQQIFNLLHHQPAMLSNAARVEVIQANLIASLVTILSAPREAASPRPLYRADIVEAARAYINLNIHRPISLDELSKTVCASRRSLIYAFQDIYGMGPITYLKYLRLNHVRVALRKGKPEYETVTNIASLWGFRSLGHFARDYRLMFGESPSETLKASGQQTNHPIRLQYRVGNSCGV